MRCVACGYDGKDFKEVPEVEFIELKHGFISVELIDQMGGDLSVVNAARVSFDKKSTLGPDGYLNERDIKLIQYLAKHNHWTPFAHTSLQFRIKAPIFVARQLVKHQVGGVWNEVSRRYVDDEPEFYFPYIWRGKPTDGAKQGSSGVVNWTTDDFAPDVDAPSSLCKEALKTYNRLLELGVAPEQARMVLPQNTMTEWIWTGSLVFWARVVQQRAGADAQAETKEVAMGIARYCEYEFPESWHALMGAMT